MRELEKEVKEIVVETRRKKILKQVEIQIRRQETAGSCRVPWGGAAVVPRTPSRRVFDRKEKAELAASFCTEVFSNRKETDRDLQVKPDIIEDRLGGDQSLVRENFPVVSY